MCQRLVLVVSLLVPLLLLLASTVGVGGGVQWRL